MAKKKLVYILNHYSESSSQHFFHVLNLLEKIAQQGVSIKLIIEKSEGIPQVFNSNIEINCLSNKGMMRLVELFWLIFELRKKGYNKLFVRISNWGAIIAILNSFLWKLEVYYWHSGTVFEFDKEQKLNYKKIKWFFSSKLPFILIKKYVTYFVTGPESMKEYYANIVGVKEAKIKILYNDIDLDRFCRLEKVNLNIIKKYLRISTEKKVILFVHRFSPVRKTKMYVYQTLEKFFSEKQFQNYLFFFIGDGIDKDEIEQEIKSLYFGEKVHFLGALPNAEVHKYYQVADIFINPTHAEGFPRVLIEAMACGLPVVTTNAGGIKDIIGIKQSQYMSDINDPSQFANNLIRMAYLSESERDLIINENLHTVEKYSTENVAKMYINTIYNE